MDNKYVWERNVFEEVEKEIKQMIRKDKYVQIEIDIQGMSHYKRITDFEAKEIANAIVGRYSENVFIKETDMNDFRKLAKLVLDNNLTVKEKDVRGTGGGYDDYSGYYFFKGDVQLGNIFLKTRGYRVEQECNLNKVLSELEKELRNLEHANVIDLESLDNYLKSKIKKDS